MPVEAKPLFRPDVLRSHLSGFQMPAVDSAKLAHWAGEISSGRVDRFNEQEIFAPALILLIIEADALICFAFSAD